MPVFDIRAMHEWMHCVRVSNISMPQFGILMNLMIKEKMDE
jgi:hypothetical protein